MEQENPWELERHPLYAIHCAITLHSPFIRNGDNRRLWWTKSNFSKILFRLQPETPMADPTHRASLRLQWTTVGCRPEAKNMISIHAHSWQNHYHCKALTVSLWIHLYDNSLSLKTSPNCVCVCSAKMGKVSTLICTTKKKKRQNSSLLACCICHWLCRMSCVAKKNTAKHMCDKLYI